MTIWNNLQFLVNISSNHHAIKVQCQWYRTVPIVQDPVILVSEDLSLIVNSYLEAISIFNIFTMEVFLFCSYNPVEKPPFSPPML